MACRLAAFASLSPLRSSASMRRLVIGSTDSSALHSGQRLAKPGLSGFSSNSSEQMAQTLMGKGIISMIKPTSWGVYRFAGASRWSAEDISSSADRKVHKSRSDRTARSRPGGSHLFDLSDDMEIGRLSGRLCDKKA
jgi:hypothetical protein